MTLNQFATPELRPSRRLYVGRSNTPHRRQICTISGSVPFPAVSQECKAVPGMVDVRSGYVFTSRNEVERESRWDSTLNSLLVDEIEDETTAGI